MNKKEVPQGCSVITTILNFIFLHWVFHIKYRFKDVMTTLWMFQHKHTPDMTLMFGVGLYQLLTAIRQRLGNQLFFMTRKIGSTHHWCGKQMEKSLPKAALNNIEWYLAAVDLSGTNTHSVPSKIGTSGALGTLTTLCTITSRMDQE